MEHKPCKATFRRTNKEEHAHCCGYNSCRYYTESYEEPEGVWHHDEHCLAGCTYEHMRHTVNCDKWEAIQNA